jgi:hypothetical protein
MRKYHHLGEDGEYEVLWEREIEERSISVIVFTFTIRLGLGAAA